MSEMSFVRIDFNIKSSVNKDVLLSSKIKICCSNNKFLSIILSLLEDGHLFVRRNVDSLDRVCPTILFKVRDISAKLQLVAFSVGLIVNNRTWL